MNGQRSEEVRRQQQQLLEQVIEKNILEISTSFPKLCFVKYLDLLDGGFFNDWNDCTKYPKSNSHSQIKRPEPSDGFLKYLEDEVSVSTRISDGAPSMCGHMIRCYYKKEDIGTPIPKSKLCKSFLFKYCLASNVPFRAQKLTRQEGPTCWNVWAQKRHDYSQFLNFKQYLQ